MKKPPSKGAQKYSNFFYPYIAAQTAQTEEFMFQMRLIDQLYMYRTETVGHPTFSNCVKSLLKICCFAVIQFVASVAFESWKPMFLFPATKWYRIFHFLHFYACTTLKLHSILLKVLSLGGHHEAKAPTYLYFGWVLDPALIYIANVFYGWLVTQNQKCLKM